MERKEGGRLGRRREGRKKIQSTLDNIYGKTQVLPMYT
jgi:hypothetical protein